MIAYLLISYFVVFLHCTLTAGDALAQFFNLRDADRDGGTAAVPNLDCDEGQLKAK